MAVRLIKANFINPISDNQADLSLNSFIAIEDSHIVKISEDLADFEAFISTKGMSVADIEDYSSKLLLPCFADVHFHWVQEDVCKMPKANLMSWLEAYTWPSEAKFESPIFSKVRAESFAQYIRSQGTSAGAVYSSIHEHAVDDILAKLEGDFLVGAVMMTQNSPWYLLESDEDSIKKTKNLAKRYAERYVVTPRFAPSCTAESMKAGAKIAAEYNSWIQTHVAETTDALESNLNILDECNLLTPKTILGHCIHLSKHDYELLAKRGSHIAHCPSSNAPIDELGLGSGLFDFKKVEEAGMDSWALASDIGAGPYLSMFDVMRSFVDQNQRAGIEGATATKALYRSTLKGMEILGLDQVKGSFVEGKKAEYICIEPERFDDLDLAKSNPEEILRKVLKVDERKEYVSHAAEVVL